MHARGRPAAGQHRGTTFRAGDTVLGSVRSGDVGPQGDSPAPGALLPVTLPVTLPPGSRPSRRTTVAAGGDEARLDALMVEPLVSRLVLGGDGHGTALLRSAATADRHTTVSVPGSGPASVEVYDGAGHLVQSSTSRAARRRSGPGRCGRLHDRPPLTPVTAGCSDDLRARDAEQPGRVRRAGPARAAAGLGRPRCPGIVADLAERWELRLGAPFQPGGSPPGSHRRADAAGRDLVLKVGWTSVECEHEAAGLRAVGRRRHRPGARGEHVDERHDALLLERARPGTELGRALPEEEQDEVVAGLLRRLWVEPPPGTRSGRSPRCATEWADEHEARPATQPRPRPRPGRCSSCSAACR